MKVIDKTKERAAFTRRFKQALILRNHEKKSLGELKEIFGVSRTLIHQWQNKGGVPSIYSAKILSDVLSISYEWLLTGFGDIEGFQMQTPDEIALIEKYRNLTKQGRRKIMITAFTECNDHEIKPSTDTERLSAKQSALKLVSKKP